MKEEGERKEGSLERGWYEEEEGGWKAEVEERVHL